VRTDGVLQQQHGGVRAAQQRHNKAAKPPVINRINKGLLATWIG